MNERIPCSLLVLGIFASFASPACGLFWPIPDVFRPYPLPTTPLVQPEQPADIEVSSPSEFQLNLHENPSLRPEQNTEAYTDNTEQTTQHTYMYETTTERVTYDPFIEFLKLYPEDRAKDVTQTFQFPAHSTTPTFPQRLNFEDIHIDGFDPPSWITTQNHGNAGVPVAQVVSTAGAEDLPGTRTTGNAGVPVAQVVSTAGAEDLPGTRTTGNAGVPVAQVVSTAGAEDLPGRRTTEGTELPSRQLLDETNMEANPDGANKDVEYLRAIYGPLSPIQKKSNEALKNFLNFSNDANENSSISDDPILKILARTDALRSWAEMTDETKGSTEPADIRVFEDMRSKRRNMLKHSSNAAKVSKIREKTRQKEQTPTGRQQQQDLRFSGSGMAHLHTTVNRVSTFTGYGNVPMNYYTEVCTCNCNNFPNLATPAEPRCRWEMVFKAVAGNGRSVYDDFMSDNVFNAHHPEAREINNERPYKDFYKLEFWNELIIHQVRIDVYKQTARMAWFLFDAIGADKLNWMRSYRIISSSYTSLRDYDFNVVSVQGFGDQRFVMNIDNDDCCDHSGFLEVQDPLTSSATCAYQDYEDRPYFLYSTDINDYGYFETTGDYGIGDRFVISIKTCDDDW